MTTKILSGTYSNGYTLAATYTGVSVTGTGMVGGAQGAAGVNNASRGGAGAYYGGDGGSGGVGLTLPGGGALANDGQIAGGKGGQGGQGAIVYYYSKFSGPVNYGGPGAGGAGGAAVLANAAATIDNVGTIAGGAGGAGGGASYDDNFNGGAGGVGVKLLAGGTITNLGTILGGAGGGNSAGGGAITLAGAGSVTNGDATHTGALIEAGASTPDVEWLDGPAVGLAAGGTVTNFGTIEGYVAVSLGGAGTVTNFGTIEGLGTVTQFGTGPGTGGVAVELGSASDVLIGEAGSVFIGLLIGAGGTLELMGDNGGMPVSLTGFGAVSLADGASCDFAGQTTLAGGLTVGAGSSVRVDGTLSTFGAVSGALTVNGELSVLAGKTFSLRKAALTNFSAGVLTGGDFVLGAHGILQLTDNEPLTTLDGEIQLDGAGWAVRSYATATSAQINLAASLVTIGAAGKLDLQGGAAFKSTTSLTNEGTLEIGGGLMNLTSLTNLSGGTLSGGTFAADAGGAIELPGMVTSLNAGIVLTGAGSRVQALDPATLKQVGLEASLTQIGAKGVLDILGHRGWTSKNTLTSAGTIDFAGGTFQTAGLISSGAVDGYGVFAGAVSNSGTIASSYKSLGNDFAMVFTGPVTNSGYMRYATFDGRVTNTGSIHNGIFKGSIASTGGVYDGHFYGGASLAGELTGFAAWFDGGSSTLESGLSLNVFRFYVQGAATGVTLAENVALGPESVTQDPGEFYQTGGVINTGAFTLTLSGGASIGPNATMTGSGTVALDEDSTVSGLTIGGTETVTNHATLTQTGEIVIGDGSAAAAGFTNLAGGIDRLEGSVGFARGAAAGSLLTNAGILQSTATTGVNLVAVDFTNNGAVQIAAGGTLEFTGPTNVLAGAVTGGGTLALGGGATTLTASLSLPIATLSIRDLDTVVTLAASRAYNGHFAQSGGTLDTAGFNLVLNGPASFGPRALIMGGGTLKLTGATTVAGVLTIGGGEKASSTGTLTLGGQLVLGDASASPASFTNSGAFDIAANVGIATGAGAASSFIDSGTLAKTGGTGVSRVAVAVTNSGTITVDMGTFEFDRAVSGAGSVQIAAGVADFTSTFSQNVSFTGASGELELAKSQTYAGQISGFSTSGGTSLDLVDIAFVSGTTNATYSGTTAAGVLTVTDGTHTSKIHLAGNFTGSSWTLASDGHGGTTVGDPPGGAASARPLASAMASFAPASAVVATAVHTGAPAANLFTVRA